MQDKETPQATSIDDLARHLRQSQSDNLDAYLQVWLKATGLSVENVVLVQQTFLEDGMAGNRYWFERKGRNVPSDDALRTLQQKAAAFDEWHTKTDWVQDQHSSFPFNTLGLHRADVMRQEIERLRALVAEPRTDQEIVDQTNELASELAGLDGWILDGMFHDHPDSRAGKYWDMACAAQEKLTATDPNDALSNLQNP